jgi:hypothetical protein
VLREILGRLARNPQGLTGSVSVVNIWSKDCLDLSADFVGDPFGLVRKDGKAGPTKGNGSDVYAVSQSCDRLAHDE